MRKKRARKSRAAPPNESPASDESPAEAPSESSADLESPEPSWAGKAPPPEVLESFLRSGERSPPAFVPDSNLPVGEHLRALLEFGTPSAPPPTVDWLRDALNRHFTKDIPGFVVWAKAQAFDAQSPVETERWTKTAKAFESVLREIAKVLHSPRTSKKLSNAVMLFQESSTALRASQADIGRKKFEDAHEILADIVDHLANISSAHFEGAAANESASKSFNALYQVSEWCAAPKPHHDSLKQMDRAHQPEPHPQAARVGTPGPKAPALPIKVPRLVRPETAKIYRSWLADFEEHHWSNKTKFAKSKKLDRSTVAKGLKWARENRNKT